MLRNVKNHKIDVTPRTIKFRYDAPWYLGSMKFRCHIRAALMLHRNSVPFLRSQKWKAIMTELQENRVWKGIIYELKIRKERNERILFRKKKKKPAKSYIKLKAESQNHPESRKKKQSKKKIKKGNWIKILMTLIKTVRFVGLNPKKSAKTFQISIKTGKRISIDCSILFLFLTDPSSTNLRSNAR